MLFILRTGPAVLAGRIPDEAYAMLMILVRACRVIFAPPGQTKEDIDNMDKELREFCRLFYLKAYGNDIKNITLCRSTVVGLLDIKRHIMACGPTGSYWKFVMERYNGTLPPLIKSRSSPHAALVNGIATKYRAELIATYTSSFHRELWASASVTAPAGTPSCFLKSLLAFPSSEDRKITQLSPRKKAEVLVGDELKEITKVLSKDPPDDGVQGLPEMILANK